MNDALAQALQHADRSVRLQALSDLCASQARPAAVGTNTHVHTNYSFSAFASPAEAAALAWQAGVEIFGINDHYTVDGHGEFREACAALDLPATFSIESVAMDRDAAAAGTLLNDPGNPGRTYLCGKGVTTPDDAEATATLAALREHQRVRNQAMTKRVATHFQATIDDVGPTWNDIDGQTPCGNTTERHIARAGCERLAALAGGDSATNDDLYLRVVGVARPGQPAADQNTFRSALLKSGKPCYVDEDPAAYPDLVDLRALYCQLGAIPTYPVLGNPITGGEDDIAALCDHLAARGIFALELIPTRNTDDRVAAVLAEAERRGWPVFDGTEHNTPTMEPLVTEWGTDARFRGRFREAALVLLGHQARVADGLPGYVDRSGSPVADGYQACLAAGEAAFNAVVAPA